MVSVTFDAKKIIKKRIIPPREHRLVWRASQTKTRHVLLSNYPSAQLDTNSLINPQNDAVIQRRANNDKTKDEKRGRY
jgi:hypothetical protein